MHVVILAIVRNLSIHAQELKLADIVRFDYIHSFKPINIDLLN